jgi:hypothetical protein
MPRIFYTDTSSEYWRGDAGLSHTDLASGGDAEPAAEARRYLFSSTQHGAGSLPLNDSTMFGTRGSNPINIVDYRPLYRAALSNLLAWISSGTEPPASVFPRAADDTRLRRAEALASLAEIPGLALPAAEVMTSIHPLDLGPDAARGIAVLPARFSAASYPDWVSAVDGDGNERAGIAMPDVSVPVATHLGFNPRHPGTGGAGQLLEYIGSSLPFAADEETRLANGDPRSSLADRYRDREDYLGKVRAAAEALIERRHLLAEDLDTCLEIAARRYDACLAWTGE